MSKLVILLALLAVLVGSALAKPQFPYTYEYYAPQTYVASYSAPLAYPYAYSFPYSYPSLVYY